MEANFEPRHRSAKFWLKSKTDSANFPRSGSKSPASSIWRSTSSASRRNSSDLALKAASSMVPPR
ncbi:MAG: hypothetical protein AB7F75_00930 [Planctomycetota bacterium]